jgi:hypothetical protein
VNKIPDPIKEVFAELRDAITSLHARWKIYRELFAHSEERTKLLKKSAPTFFVFIHEVLIDHIQLSIGKLTDPPGTGDKQNLSLRMLDRQVLELHDENLSSKLENILVDLCGGRVSKKAGKCAPIKTHRDKRIAHADLKTSIQHGSDPLPGVSRQMIEDVLVLLRNYMNAIEGHYCQSAYLYQNPMIGPYDTVALMTILKDGLEFRRLEVESLQKQYGLHDC